MDEMTIRNTLIRLYAILDELSYCIYDNFLNYYNLSRKEYGKVTLIEFYVYSLFVMNKFIERYEVDDTLYNELLKFSQNLGLEKFCYYLNSEKDIMNRYKNYERYYLNDQIRDLNNLSILCEDYALRSEGLSLLNIEYSENEDINIHSSQKTDFTDEIIEHSLLLKKAAQEIIAYRTEYESDEVIWSIRKNYENNQLFIGGAELIGHISRDSPTPPESNPLLMQLWTIKTANNDIKNKEIARVDEILYMAIKNCYEADSKNAEADEMIASYFSTKIVLGGNLVYTKAELIQCWLEYSITGLQSTFSATMNFNDEIVSKIRKNLSKSDLKLVDYLLNVFYPEYLKGEYSVTGIDETYTKLFGTRIYDSLKILFGDYVYYEINGIQDLSTYFSLIDIYGEKGKLNSANNSVNEDEDEFFDDEDIFDNNVELCQSDDIEDLYSYGKIFYHLMAMYSFKESKKNHVFQYEIKKQSVFDALRIFILQIENFKHVTPEIIEFFNITKDKKILNAIYENQGVGYMNLMSELNFRLEHMDKHINYNSH